VLAAGLLAAGLLAARYLLPLKLQVMIQILGEMQM
jgi:hypothetical protein